MVGLRCERPEVNETRLEWTWEFELLYILGNNRKNAS